jgi:hypothetical protein
MMFRVPGCARWVRLPRAVLCGIRRRSLRPRAGRQSDPPPPGEARRLGVSGVNTRAQAWTWLARSLPETGRHAEAPGALPSEPAAGADATAARRPRKPFLKTQPPTQPERADGLPTTRFSR